MLKGDAQVHDLKAKMAVGERGISITTSPSETALNHKLLFNINELNWLRGLEATYTEHSHYFVVDAFSVEKSIIESCIISNKKPHSQWIYVRFWV